MIENNENEEKMQEEYACPVSRPEIQINSRQLRDVIQDTWDAIHAANVAVPKIFQRCKNVVSLGYVDDVLQLVPMSPDYLFGLLVRNIDWVRMNEKGKLTPAKPQRDVARDILTHVDPLLPPLESIISTPIFCRDGRLISRPGYHPEHKVYFDPASLIKLPPVTDLPAASEVEAARKLIIDELFCDFPFEQPSDRAHAITALLHPFVRALFSGCSPLILIEAPSPGSGKNLLTNLIAIIATGRTAEARTLPGSDDEIRKMITAELARGRPLILLDNADHDLKSNKLHSPTLASVLTTEMWTDRILGVSQMTSLPNKALWIMTGNNPQVTSELSRRFVRVRLDPKTDRPWQRQPSEFRHANLVEWAQSNRVKVIHAVLTLIQNWIAMQMPDGLGRIGSFEDWSRVMGGILRTSQIEG